MLIGFSGNFPRSWLADNYEEYVEISNAEYKEHLEEYEKEISRYREILTLLK